jgi:hypothetical protein
MGHNSLYMRVAYSFDGYSWREYKDLKGGEQVYPMEGTGTAADESRRTFLVCPISVEGLRQPVALRDCVARSA